MVSEECRRLPSRLRASAEEAVSAIMAGKAAIHDVVAEVDAGTMCASCKGACCRSGKYHFTAVDLLVYLVEGKALFVPRFNQEACPYLGEQGCLMSPVFRPFTCITFNCELVDGLLEPAEKDRLRSLEHELRGHYSTLENLFGIRLRGGLLMDGERAALQGRSAILLHRPGSR